MTEPNSLEITNSATQGVSCFDYSDGSIGITVEGGVEEYDYEWSNGATSEDISNLSFGTYEVFVTDNNGNPLPYSSL